MKYLTLLISITFFTSVNAQTMYLVTSDSCVVQPTDSIVVYENDTFLKLNIIAGKYNFENANRFLFRYVLPDSAPDGSYILMFDNNQLALKLNYKNGVKNGEQIEWHYHGTKRSKKNYQNGKLNGTQTTYDLTENRISLVENYKNGVKHGSTFSYSSDGAIVNLEFYKNGKKKRKSKWLKND